MVRPRRRRALKLLGGLAAAAGLMMGPAPGAVGAAETQASSAGNDAAPGFVTPGTWLPTGSDIGELPAREPVSRLHVEQAGGTPSFLVSLGNLAFRSPELLGGNARRAGLSCSSCHPGGDRNRTFHIPGLTDNPGTVDVTDANWNLRDEDQRHNPLRIPSLRGVAQAGPYGFQGRFADLGAFTRHVMVVEFQGAEPLPVLLDALVAYESELALPTNPRLLPDGRLAAGAGAAEKQGERLFAAHCAACHIPEHGFRDGKLHDIGSGGAVKTPSLLGSALGGPYFHDGRFTDLAAAAAHALPDEGAPPTAEERTALLAYIRAVGGVADADRPVSLTDDLARLRQFTALLDLPLREGDAALAELVSRMLRGEIGRIDRRFPQADAGPARATLAGWARRLGAIGKAAEAGTFPAARSDLALLRRDMATTPDSLHAALAGSLYDPAALATFKTAPAPPPGSGYPGAAGATGNAPDTPAKPAAR